MPGLSRFDCYPRDWLSGTRGLSIPARGVYFDLLCILYDTGKPVPHDESYLCRALGIRDKRTLRRPLQELIDADKIQLDNGVIINERWRREMATYEKRIADSKRGGRPPSKDPKTTSKATHDISHNHGSSRTASELRANCEPTQGGGIVPNQALSQNPPSPSPSKKERSASRFAFKGKVIKLLADDLNTWRKAYSAIPDIEAALQGLDDFYSKEPAAKQCAWFIRASRALEKQHQDYLAKNPKAKRRRNIPDVRDLPDEPLWPPEEAQQ